MLPSRDLRNRKPRTRRTVNRRHKYIFSSLLAIMVDLLIPSVPAMSEGRSHELFYIASPMYGPTRLGEGWTEPSVLACAASCMIRYPASCQGVMYNSVTRLCTPGQWLNQSAALPTAEEGDLYITYQCDPAEGFQILSYGSTTACVAPGDTPVDHATAQSTCAALGSHLYTTKDLDKFYMLQSLIKDTTWIGLNDLQTEARYLWDDDGSEWDVASPLSLSMFHLSEPNDNLGREDCVTMRFLYGKMLNDVSCDAMVHFVCEKPLLTLHVP